MADFGSPVAKPIDPNQGLNTLSNLISLKSGMQGLRGQQAQVQQEQQTARQRSALAKIDWSKNLGPDGTLDLNAFAQDTSMRQAAGDQWPELWKQALDVKSGQIQAKQSMLTLDSSRITALAKMAGGLRTDPDVVNDTAEGRQKVKQAFDTAADTYGPEMAQVAQRFAPMVQHVPQGKIASALQAFQLQALDLAPQVKAQEPNFGTVDVGGKVIQTQDNPLAAGGVDRPGTQTKGIAPSVSYFVDAKGNLIATNPQNPGKSVAVGQGEGLGGGGGGKPSGVAPEGKPNGYKPPVFSGVGERDTLLHQAEQNFANVTTIRHAANTVPQQLDQINKARELSKVTDTGQWTRRRAEIESGLSALLPGLKSAQDDATKIQVLDKFLERITSDSEKVLGTSSATDAARDSIHRMNANVGYTPEAIRAVLDYAAAQSEAMLAKSKAQERWLKAPGNSIAGTHQEFETKWREAYDPVLFQLKVATPAEKKKIISQLPPEESASLSGKYKALQELENGR
jgi:hypothetical protein